MTRENSGFGGFLARVGSAIALLAVVVGGLWVLLNWGRLGALLSVDWRDIWTRPDDGRLLLGVLTVVGWLAWVLVVGTVFCESVASLSRGRWRPRMPGAGWLRPMVGALVVTVFGLSAVTSLMGHQSLGAAVGGAASVGQARVSADGPVASLAASVQGATVPYVVQPGDDLWSLAEQFAGGGENWRVIAAANDTVVLDPGVELTPGTMLMVPQAASAALLRADAPSNVAGDAATVTVRPGDSLWGLSESNLGDGQRWPEIYDANRTVITDPRLIYPGETLVLPGSDASADDSAKADGAGSSVTDDAEAVPSASVPDSSDGPSVADDHLALVFSEAAQIGAGAGAATATAAVAPQTTAAAPAPVGEGDDAAVEAPRSPESMIASLLGSIGVGLASALVVGLGASRLMQLRERGVGRQLPRLTPGMQEFETALDRRARNLLGGVGDDDDDSDDNDDAMWIRPIAPRRELASDVLSRPAPSGPSGGVHQPPILRLLDDDDAAPPVRGTVNLGVGSDDAEVTFDLVDAGLVQILGPQSQVAGMMAAMAGQVLALPAEERPEVMLAASSLGWLAGLLDCPLMSSDIAESLVSHRLSAGGVAVEQLVVFTDGYMPTVGEGCGITIVSSWSFDRRPDAEAAIEIDDVDSAKLWLNGSAGKVFQAQLVSAPARRTLVELVDAVTSLDFPAAPWWTPEDAAAPSGDDAWLPVDSASEFETPIDTGRLDSSPDVFALDDALAHPVLRLFGPVELTGARGVVPSQAAKQCLEYCGWLLRNPGQTSTTMAKSLLVAEATRRSNMSRLRLWLGCDDAGEPYLPDAYSGRIVLHDGVTSDWQRMNALVGAVNQASEHSLIDALRLVRGAPLADAAPGQWRWAEEWRCDMVSLARDIAAVLCEKAIARGDVELARWAVMRGLLAASGDVVLQTLRVRVEKLAGNLGEVQRLAANLTQQASRSGFDLPSRTASVLQEALEGAPRALGRVA